jgi:hypothetical protein
MRLKRIRLLADSAMTLLWEFSCLSSRSWFTDIRLWSCHPISCFIIAFSHLYHHLLHIPLSYLHCIHTRQFALRPIPFYITSHRLSCSFMFLSLQSSYLCYSFTHVHVLSILKHHIPSHCSLALPSYSYLYHDIDRYKHVIHIYVFFLSPLFRIPLPERCPIALTNLKFTRRPNIMILQNPPR